MKYVTVLDFESGKVCVYSLPLGYEDVEDFISMNHRVDNCEWMTHNNAPELFTKHLNYE